MVWMWLTLAVILTVVETSTAQFVSIWFAVASAVTTVVVAFFPEINIGWQLLIFTALSLALLAATRPFVKRLIARRTEAQKTNLELVLGREAIVVEDVDNINGLGAVKVGGLVWSARSEDGTAILKDDIVTVVKIEGNKLVIKK